MEGRQLKEVTNAEGKTQFEYDANGLRTQKRIYRPDGKLWLTVNYTWENGIIVSQSMVMIMYVTTNGVTKEVPLGPITSKIIYDDNKQAVGYILNDDEVFMLVKNLQGDVIALIDEQGDTVLEYSYDPWGKLEYRISDPDMNETTAMIFTSLCPLTYRGYNYDFSTGLYYLQSRYYNPEWGRLVNTDDPQMVLNMVGDDHGANQFLYCMNNPVNYSDHSGYWGKDVHYELTEIWARDFFNASDARTIASADLDMDKSYAPFPPNTSWIEDQKYHFNRNAPGSIDSRSLFAILMLFVAACLFVGAELSYVNSEKLIWDYNTLKNDRREALICLGNGLHSLQDIEAHGNIGVGNGYKFTQHLISSDGRNIHKADDFNYNWTNGSKTALIKDYKRTRYNITKNDTTNYFYFFYELVFVLRIEYGVPYIKI